MGVRDDWVDSSPGDKPRLERLDLRERSRTLKNLGNRDKDGGNTYIKVCLWTLPICPLSLLSFNSDGELIFFAFCDSFLSFRFDKYSKRLLPTSNKGTSVSIILPVTFYCVGHKVANIKASGCVTMWLVRDRKTVPRPPGTDHSHQSQ